MPPRRKFKAVSPNFLPWNGLREWTERRGVISRGNLGRKGCQAGLFFCGVQAGSECQVLIVRFISPFAGLIRSD